MLDSKPATILVVDDDPGLQRLVQTTLRRSGYITAGAGSGMEAMKWLACEQPDLMLLDLKLQDTGGAELIKSLGNQGKTVPFIVITGQGDERSAVEMMKRGALDYLVKDVQFMDLVPTFVGRALHQLEKDKRLVAAQMALKESQEQLLAISEREQRRFGAELHDGLGQQLTAIELRCQSLKEDLRGVRADLDDEISQICQYLREAIAQTRSLAHGLSPVNLEAGGLAGALREMSARMTAKGRVQCHFRPLRPVAMNDAVVAGHLFRIAQEAVNNAVKHARARNVEVCLDGMNGKIRLTIADDGRGMPKSLDACGGIGLQVMRHRASVIGGELELQSKPGRGVTVVCTLRTKAK